ncbi:MAG: YceI family protein [Chloroflexi bacterium]|nr:YceI family protein [Chloroflexota bacterium]MDA1239834.1 YceI family protein [Chloroflexota bacterium]
MTRWNLDTAHTEVGFSVKHMMVANVKGRFHGVTAEIAIDEDHPERSTVLAEIETGTVDTRQPDRDTHLRSGDFFDSERFPLMTFRSTEVRRTGEGQFAITGDLTIRDVTKPVTLTGVLSGPLSDVYGGRRAGIDVSGEIEREAWGLGWNVAMEAGGVMVGKRVKIVIEGEIVQAVADAEVEAAA